jgi:Cu/Ag efflux pump CusA
MMGAVLGWVLQFRILVLVVAAGVLGYGFTALPAMSVDAFPEFAPPQVEIQTEALGLSAAEVEQLVTSPMEADLLNGVAWVEAIRSKSLPGLSSVQLVFQPGTDMFRARQLVAERLTQARALPNVSAAPVLMQPLSSTSRVMMIKLTSTDMSPIDMSVLARWTMKPALLAVPGVANISIWGQRDQQLQVLVDPKQLEAKGVTLDQVIRTTGNSVWVSPLSYLEASTPGTGGFLETGHQRLGVQHVLPITTPQDLGRISVQGSSDKLLLGDVAKVQTDHQPLIGDAQPGRDAELLLVVEKFPETNTADVTRGLDETMRELQAGLPGVTVDTTVYRQESFVEQETGTLAVALLATLLLVAVATGLVFRSWRSALISLISIPLSLIAAAVLLSVRGAGLNTMVFTGMVLALAVIIGDVLEDLNGTARAYRAAREAGTGDARSTLVASALRPVRASLFYSLLIMALSVLPLLFVPGENGAMFSPLVLSYLLSMAVAMAVALTVTAALVFLLPPAAAPRGREGQTMQRLRIRYGRALSGRRGRPVAVFAATAAVALAALALAPQLVPGTPVVPVLADNTLVVQWSAAPGTSDEEMVRITNAAADELRSVPGVASVASEVGRAVTSDQVGDVSSGELWVGVAKDASYTSTVEDVQKVVEGYPGMRATVSTYPQQKIDQIRAAADSAFGVRVYGVDMPTLRAKAEEVRQVLAHTAGIVNPRVEAPVEQPTVQVKVDLAAAQKAGVIPGDVRRAAAALLQGIEVGNVYEQQKVFSVVVKGEPSTRNSLTSVRELLIDTPKGGHVRLGDVADVSIVPNDAVILHDDTSRRVDVKADIQGRGLAEVQQDIDRALQQMQFPVAYHAEILTQYAQQQSSIQWLWLLTGVAAFGILVLLQTALGGWRIAAAVFIGLLASLSGGVLAALADGGANYLAAFVAFSAVLGIAVRNFLLLAREVRSLRARDAGGADSSTARAGQIVIRAARDRLSPTLGSAVITAVALLPLVLLGGVTGTEIIQPIAIIVWGGLLTTTLFALFVLPAILIRFDYGQASTATAPTEAMEARTGA